jgi:hypothetical protein
MDGPTVAGIHAEDGAIFQYYFALYNGIDNNSLPPQSAHPLRMMAYGYKRFKKLIYGEPSAPGKLFIQAEVTEYRADQTHLCITGVGKKPSCQDVAKALGIRFLPKGKPAKDQDLEDQARSRSPTPTPPPSSGGSSASFEDPSWTPALLDAMAAIEAKHQKPRPPANQNSGGGDGNMTAKDTAAPGAMGNAKSTTGKPQGQTQQGGQRLGGNKIDQLTQSMARLNTGGRSIAPPRPQGQRPPGALVPQPPKGTAGGPAKPRDKGQNTASQSAPKSSGKKPPHKSPN